MATSTARSIFMGPRLRRLRRDLGLTQADMAADLDISAPYVALLERNQRPVTADMLLRLARTYKIDLADLAGDGGADHTARMQSILKEPMFSDIDIPALEISDLAISYPGMTEAFLRLYTAYREEQLALADRRAPATRRRRVAVGCRGTSTPTIPSRKSGGFWPHAAIISRTSTMRLSASSRLPPARAELSNASEFTTTFRSVICPRT